MDYLYSDYHEWDYLQKPLDLRCFDENDILTSGVKKIIIKRDDNYNLLGEIIGSSDSRYSPDIINDSVDLLLAQQVVNK